MDLSRNTSKRRQKYTIQDTDFKCLYKRLQVLSLKRKYGHPQVQPSPGRDRKGFSGLLQAA